MRKNLWVLPLLTFSALIAPVQVIAQTQQPSAPPQDYYWPGPWHMMWGWGMFPMMLLFFILFFVVIFFFARVCMALVLCIVGFSAWVHKRVDAH